MGFGYGNNSRSGGFHPLPAGPYRVTYETLSSDPYFMISNQLLEEFDEILPDVGPHWDETEDWEDAMPPRPRLTTPVSEWDVDALNPAWVIGRTLPAGLGVSVSEAAEFAAAWPKRVPCVCGHTRTYHRSHKAGIEFGPCKARNTTITPDGGFGSEPCPCTDPEPAIAEEAS